MRSTQIPHRRPAQPARRWLLTAVVLTAVTALTAACSTARGPLHPFPVPGPSPGTTGEPITADGRAISQVALALRGVPYTYGGSSPDTGFDCSGLVQWVFRRVGVILPRETQDQFLFGASVDRAALLPGDLVFFTTGPHPASHVGIVIGPDQFVHAPNSRGVVRVERLSASYWQRRYLGARRPHARAGTR
ncbi:MAG: NlpC/P60 family protein [Acidobacteria bacterium]|nr:NlpC/P60 family protein [Acidobacteriota bacterium]